MKLSETLVGQRMIVQLLWGEQKIEFPTEVLINDSTGVYINPYIHNGAPLELNVSLSKGVVCNLFTDDPYNKQRISWRNVELSTVRKDDETMYLVTTAGFNAFANSDDRRQYGRIIIQLKAQVKDSQSAEPIDVIVHDISDVGISFFAPAGYEPKSPQLTITFRDTVDNRDYNVRVECLITRTTKRAGNIMVGCRTVGNNNDYLLYSFVMRLRDKNGFRTVAAGVTESTGEGMPAQNGIQQSEADQNTADSVVEQTTIEATKESENKSPAETEEAKANDDNSSQAESSDVNANDESHS